MIQYIKLTIKKMTENKKQMVVSAGRQTGKTINCVITYFKKCWKPNSNTIVISPTVKTQYKLINEFKPFVYDDWGDVATFVDNNQINWINGAKIYFRNVEEGWILSSGFFDFIIVDNAADISDDKFYSLIFPLLEKSTFSFFISTPKGKDNYFYNLFISEESNSSFKSSYDSHLSNKKNVDYYKSILPDDIFRQEFLGEFV